MKRLLLTISVVCLLMLSYTAVNGAEWVYYGESVNGQRHYDKESISSVKGIIKVWSKTIYSEKGKQKYIEEAKIDGSYKKRYEDLSYATMLYVFKCDTREYDFTFGVGWDSEGSQIDTISIPSISYRPISPETVTETLYKIVCKVEKK